MQASPVNSWNEWDPLREVIVGTAWGAMIPPANDPVSALGMSHLGLGGQAFPLDFIERVQRQIDAFAEALMREGVIVRRPKPFDLSASIQTPFFFAPCGYNFMNVRDLVLVVGDQLIEAPTASRTRYFETLALRPLFKNYFQQGARWVSAPKPELSDNSFFSAHARKAMQSNQEITSEYEPLFDAADFVRCGSDIVCQRGARTNQSGIDWVRRHLGEKHRVIQIETKCRHSVHIDTTFLPVGPRRALINRKWLGTLPNELRDWELLEAPEPEGEAEFFRGLPRETSPFIAMNVFMLDPKRVFVDAQQSKLIKSLADWGFDPIPMPFELPPFLGGGFHCVTLDIRREDSSVKKNAKFDRPE